MIYADPYMNLGFPSGASGKEPTCQCRRPGFDPWVRKIPWRRKWLPTPIFLPGKSHRQRSLVDYSPQGCKRVGHDLAAKQQHYIIYYIIKYVQVHAKSFKSCPTLCDLVDCSPPGSSVHGILQARILAWIAISFSRGSSQPRVVAILGKTRSATFK